MLRKLLAVLSAAVLAAGIILACLVASGCGATHQSVARQVVTVGGYALDVTDIVAAAGYTEAARRALEASQGLPEYRAAMTHWDEAVAALEASQEALEACEAAVDAWPSMTEDVAKGRFRDALRRLVRAADRLVAVLRAAGADLPTELEAFLTMARGLVG